MSEPPCGIADAALAAEGGASGVNDEIVCELQQAADEHQVGSGEEPVDDEGDENGQGGEGGRVIDPSV
jgi:hypothetical protein